MTSNCAMSDLSLLYQSCLKPSTTVLVRRPPMPPIVIRLMRPTRMLRAYTASMKQWRCTLSDPSFSERRNARPALRRDWTTLKMSWTSGSPPASTPRSCGRTMSPHTMMPRPLYRRDAKRARCERWFISPVRTRKAGRKVLVCVFCSPSLMSADMALTAVMYLRALPAGPQSGTSGATHVTYWNRPTQMRTERSEASQSKANMMSTHRSEPTADRYGW
mmetsp:Transcript_7467/g.26670  ORF Transcript_7467/g.26670 Transcript_7467/m.26670 type:complete len:218 (+) Transcript_7467:565-1218(+)